MKRGAAGLTRVEMLAAAVIAVAMAGLLVRAAQAPVTLAVPPPSAASAEQSAVLALAAIKRDLAQLSVPAGAERQPVRLDGIGADGRALEVRFTSGREAVSYRAEAGPGTVHPMLRGDARVPGVLLRGLSFRLLSPFATRDEGAVGPAAPGDRNFYLEIALDACDTEGRLCVRRLDVSVLRTSTRLE